MDDTIRNRIELATVTVIKADEADIKGRGFVVHGGYILTAAHCVPWNGDGLMALDIPFHVTVVTPHGQRITGRVVAVEPVSDIAVIGSPDCQAFYAESNTFDDFVESGERLIVCDDEYPFGEWFPVHVFTHECEWISGKAMYKGDASTLCFQTRPTIPNGTSGSIFVNDRGEVVGIVSSSTETNGDEPSSGTCGRPCQCLPVWILRAIKEDERKCRAAEGNTDSQAGEADCQ